ncbi:MAG: phosphoribosylformylglycinamidine cyclo-ligase [Lentisphaeria bacterium]|nr:phosphoribosylformylglycinamidine cyclo-ligase [Lentisphaeria bacterium]
MSGQAKSDLYKNAGVDIDLAHDLLDRVKKTISKTRRPEVLAPIGGFGGLFQLDLSKYREPVMVSSVDGVGTKLMVAMLMEKYDTVGYDIVNHCIDDIIVQGAEPVYFMDYLGIGKLRSPLYEEVLSGLANACLAQHVALLGGETAEMPGMYGDDFDLVGCITGIVEKSRLITGDSIRPGDVMIGLGSSGLHTNGYSLARKILFDGAGYSVHSKPDGLDVSVGDALLEPHICYWPGVKNVLEARLDVRGMAHITGGGWYDNIVRVLPDRVNAVCRKDMLPIPPIFELIRMHGNIEEEEMYRVFNMGMGFVIVVAEDDAEKTLGICRENGFAAEKVGHITDGSGKVIVE